MALILNALVDILKRPTVGGVASELALFAAPLWLAVLVGLVIGWAWRPRWAADLVDAKKVADLYSSDDDSSGSCLKACSSSSSSSSCCFTIVEPSDEVLAVTNEDLRHLNQLVEVTDGGPDWMPMMERSMPGFSYRAWKREPQNGPPQYRSSTIFDNATPEEVRDFFWDDEFRTSNRWDNMLLQHTVLEKCMKTGTMIVRWVRKFPFFCSDREYIIGRRIWDTDGTYYCVTKGVPRPSVPRQNKPRRVDLYYSSWCIRAVESRRGDGQKTACEVLLFHHEDMGIPWDIAKLGVRQGMWGCVKRIEPGLRAYQTARREGKPPSQYASIARVNTKVNASYLRSLERNKEEESVEENTVEVKKQNRRGSYISKFIMVGGVIAVACTLDRGLLTKAVIFGAARRFGKLGR